VLLDQAGHRVDAPARAAVAGGHRQVKILHVYKIQLQVKNLPDNLRLWQTSSEGEFNVRFVNLTMPGPAAPASPTQPGRSRPRRARGAGCGCCRAATPGRRAQRPQGRTSSRPGAPASSSARAVWRQRSRPASAWASRSRSSSSTGFGTPAGKSASRTSSRPSLPRVAASLRHRSSARRPSGSRCRRRAASARGDQRFRVVAHGGALAAGLAASRPATKA
jgi:hypothetical protein